MSKKKKGRLIPIEKIIFKPTLGKSIKTTLYINPNKDNKLTKHLKQKTNTNNIKERIFIKLKQTQTQTEETRRIKKFLEIYNSNLETKKSWKIAFCSI